MHAGERLRGWAEEGLDFQTLWKRFQDAELHNEEVWVPKAWGSPRTKEPSNWSALASKLQLAPEELHAWTTSHRGPFVDAALSRMGLPFPTEPQSMQPGTPLKPRWLDGAKYNVAAMALGYHWDAEAEVLVCQSEAGERRAWTRTQLQRAAGNLALLLRKEGLEPGDAVGFFTPMTDACVAAYLGVVLGGNVVVGIPDSFQAAEVRTRLELGKTQVVATVMSFTRGGRTLPMAERAVAAGAKRLLLLDEPDQAGLAQLDAWVKDGALEGYLVWDLDAARKAKRTQEPHLQGPDALTNILFSSGTTGTPKAIGWTQCTPLKSAIDGHFHQDIHRGDVVAWPTNIGWMMGPWLIYAALLNRAKVVLFEGAPTSEHFLPTMAKEGVTMLGVVPAIVRAWREAGLGHYNQLRTVRTFSNTGEASNVQDSLYLMWLGGFQAPIIEYCGGTEIGGGHLTGTVAKPHKLARFNTLALGIDAVLLSEDGKPCPAGVAGEIFLIPPSLGLSESLLNKDHHKEYYEGTPAYGDVPLRRHGDEVVLGEDGYFVALGRADDTMNLGGIKVSSIELERAVQGTPGLREAAAIALRPEGGGAEQLVFAVVLESPDTDLDGLQRVMQQEIRSQLNPLFKIQGLHVVDALPRTASNKVMRRELRAQMQTSTVAS